MTMGISITIGRDVVFDGGSCNVKVQSGARVV
jgi:hypothetical protein